MPEGTWQRRTPRNRRVTAVEAERRAVTTSQGVGVGTVVVVSNRQKAFLLARLETALRLGDNGTVCACIAAARAMGIK